MLAMRFHKSSKVVSSCSSSIAATANGFFGNHILLESPLWSVIHGLFQETVQPVAEPPEQLQSNKHQDEK